MLNFFKSIWQKNWAGKATLIGAALVLIGAVVGVVYGVATHAGDESFLKTDKGASYHWDRADLPLQCMHDDSVTEAHVGAYNDARQAINAAVGKTLIGPCQAWLLTDKPFPTKPVQGTILLHVGQPEDTQDGVTVQDPFKGHPGGSTMHYLTPDGSGRIFGTVVWVDPRFERGLNARVWIHELGHVLGLAHDRLQSSIMFSTVSARPGKLSSSDIDSLKGAYVN